MRSFLLLISFLFVLNKVEGQQRLEALRTKLLNADSVIIVSHETTAGIVVVDKAGKEVPLPKLIIKGKLNEKIIREKLLLHDTSVNKLVTIITRPFQDSEIVKGACFLPHHAVIVFKRSKPSFVDMCFGCRGVETSKDLKVTEEDFDERKWNDLVSFFLQHKMKYELENEMDAEE